MIPTREPFNVRTPPEALRVVLDTPLPHDTVWTTADMPNAACPIAPNEPCCIAPAQFQDVAERT